MVGVGAGATDALTCHHVQGEPRLKVDLGFLHASILSNFRARENSYHSANIVLVSGQDQLSRSRDAVSAADVFKMLEAAFFVFSRRN
jgi:hypothetical protein